ncbi:MAG TPA: hypothetical protein VG738_03515 [Chitinophagaceae bacterium]|nr:hypothetical protein [Chitinophagaceae bacterium]
MKWVVLAIFIFSCYNQTEAQVDSVYKYVYTFMPDTPSGLSYAIIDSSFNSIDTSFEKQILTSINGEARGLTGKPIRNLTLCLYSGKEKI